MFWYHYVAYFFGGLILTNAIPHFVSGLMGRPFQSPFAKPPGQGLSSSRVNAAWGAFNLAIAYLLLCHVGDFDLRNWGHAAAAGLASLMGALVWSHRFGRYNGGNDPGGSRPTA